jgi:CheY-like chemotaxis protein
MVAVLIVESDEATRSLAGFVLQEYGFEVSLAANGPEALWRLRQPPPVEILFTEINLDGMCGRELVGRARALKRDLRVLYTGDPPMTGPLRDPANLQAAFLPKIYSVDALIGAVRCLLRDDAACAAAPARPLT